MAEYDINNYVNLSEIVDGYTPKQKLSTRSLIQFAEEFGLKLDSNLEIAGFGGDILVLINYLVETYTDEKYIRPLRNKKFETQLWAKDIIGQYELQDKFNEDTVEAITKELGLDDESITAIYGTTNEWILFLNYLLEKFPLTKKSNDNNLVEDGPDFDYINYLNNLRMN